MSKKAAILTTLLLVILMSDCTHTVKKRSLSSGPSTYFDPNLRGEFLIQNADSGYCLKASGTILGTGICNKADDTQKWTYQNPSLLKNKGTRLCITASEDTGLVKLGQCKSASNWDCNSDNRLRPGIKLESTKKCIRVKDDRSVSLETCNAKQHGQSLIVYGTLNFMTCFIEKKCPSTVTWDNKCCVFPFIYKGKSYSQCTSKNELQDWCSLTSNYDKDKKWGWCHGRLGPRTKDPNYYFFKSPMFHISWNTKYVRVFLVYSKKYYLLLKKKYGTDPISKQKLKEHAMETVEILDKFMDVQIEPTEKNKSFYRLPKIIEHQGEDALKLSEERRTKWLSRISREDLKGDPQKLKQIRVCSDHFVSGQPSKLFMTKDIDWAPSKRLGHEKFKVTDVEGILQRNNKSAERMKKRLLNYKDVNVQSEKKKPACSLHRQLDETSEQNRFPAMEEAPEDVQRKDAPCQTELSSIDIANMGDDLKRSTEEINKLKREVLSASLTQESFENNDEKVLFYTGLPNFITLMAIFDLLEPFITITACSSLDKFQQVLLFLMRIRLNLTCEDLGYRFVLSRSTISRTFLNILDIAASRLAFLIKWPEREELWKTTPMSFKKNFKTRVAIVIDCFVVFIEKPANLLARSQTFSTYKHHNTAKFLIGICPQGVISFISKAWGGRVSDKHLTEHCGILNYLLPKDIILADRGFGIQDSAALYYAEVKIPAFTRGQKQLHSLQVKETRKIASAQIHVERVIGLVRRKYTILQSTLPTDYLGNKDSDGMTVLDKIALVACTLTNVCDSVVPFD